MERGFIKGVLMYMLTSRGAHVYADFRPFKIRFVPTPLALHIYREIGFKLLIGLFHS